MKVALAGLGAAAIRGHLPALARLQEERRINLVGAADPDLKRQLVASRMLDRVPVFSSAEEMLDSLTSDVLVIAASPGAHAQLAALGARHRQHVICEKPLTLSAEEHFALTRTFGIGARKGLIPIHQYRYSPTWKTLARVARAANRLGIPFSLKVEVCRPGTDRFAVSSWRSSRATSGGMLADHGVHFLALGWTISREFEPLESIRDWDGTDGESSRTSLRLGSGRLEIRVSSTASVRSTRIDLHVLAASLSWHDRQASVGTRWRTLSRWQTEALSDRAHVDALYLALYRDIFENLDDHSWRDSRTSEALTVGAVLVSLLGSSES